MKQLFSLDLFTVGIGPSSSHTVGPMRAAKLFAGELQNSDDLPRVARVRITLFGSLGATGAGHGTTNALVVGLAGGEADTCDPVAVLSAWQRAVEAGVWQVGSRSLPVATDDMVFLPKKRLPRHSNAMLFEALDATGSAILARTYYSVGGGFVEGEEERAVAVAEPAEAPVPYPFTSAVELLDWCGKTGLSIARLVRANSVAQAETRYGAGQGEAMVAAKLESVWAAMVACVEQGLAGEGVLPGYLKVNRRAAGMAERLREREAALESRGELANEWLQAFAIAVNEENAAGMRVVTAPTNGAAGIIPAVGYYARQFKKVTDAQLAEDYLLTAAAIGSLYKRNASISGAEAGCQGEVGSACSMAAGALTAVLGGTPKQIENAAEIAMEHNLGLTCDPVGGFVQLPCIERNAIAAGTALAAARLALNGDGSHKISLDVVIETMRQTGRDMSSKYKETSIGGLAVNVIEC